MRRPAKKTTKVWIESLNEIKSIIDLGNEVSIHRLLRAKNISNRWLPFLKENNIVFKENRYYKWNDKIPVSYKLIERFREYSKSINLLNKKQQPNLFNMPSSATPPRPKVTKTRIDSKYLSVNDIVEIYGKSESTIRRILDDAKQNGSVKEIPMKNGVKKIYISKDYLDSIFKTKVKVRFYDEPKSELGVIRKFLKWLW